jgi:hypothetical protein
VPLAHSNGRGRDMRISLMTLAAALVCVMASCSASMAGELKKSNGRWVIAQSYCAMCGNDRTTCVIKCNGAGQCIQGCDVDYRLCVERACRRY